MATLIRRPGMMGGGDTGFAGGPAPGGRYQPLPNYPAGPGVQQGFQGFQGGPQGGANPRTQAQDQVSMPPMNQPPNVHRRVGGRRGWAGGPGTHYVPPGGPQGMHTPPQQIGGGQQIGGTGMGPQHTPGQQIGGGGMTPPPPQPLGGGPISGGPTPIGAGGGTPGGFIGGPPPSTGFQGGPTPLQGQPSMQDQARVMGQRKAMAGYGSMF